MKRCLLPIGLVTLVTIACAANPPQKLVPKWTYDKGAQHYFKTMQVKAVRQAEDSNTTGYYLDLDHDKVWVTDTDENFATNVILNDKFRLELRKDPNGHPNNVQVRNGDWMYYDINCDGEWDARTIARPDKLLRLIWLNDQWVRVMFTSGRFGEGISGEIDFTDRKTEYIWDGKVWTVKPPRR